MKHTKSAGIWMEHSNAHITEYINPVQTTTIESLFTTRAKDECPGKNKRLMHNREQHRQLAYYKIYVQ